MPYENTQPRSGHLKSTSMNRKKQPGKGDGTEPLRQAKGSNALSDNYPIRKTQNRTSRVRPEIKEQRLRGYVQQGSGGQAMTVTSTGQVKKI